MSMSNLVTKPESTSSIVGTWHPRGFHGHNRAKSRIEFSNFYRQLAKPAPPTKFSSRQNADVLRHTFSHHDNRQIFLNDPLLFGTGFGKKKIDSVNKSKWNPEFISWQDASINRIRQNRSIYQRDYSSSQNLAENSFGPKLLTGRQAFDNNALSVYKVNYSHGEPTGEHSKDIREETYYRFISKNRAKSCMNGEDMRRTTVASCLVWNDPVRQIVSQTEPTVAKFETTVNSGNTTQQ